MGFPWAQVAKLFGILACGAVEGYAFYRCGIASPASITGQMKFQCWVVMKLFLGAVGSSMVTQGVLHWIAPHLFDNSRVFKYATWGMKRVAIGSLLLGSGMALSGSGPTMVPAQIGAGVVAAGHIALGVLVGAIVFAEVEKKYLSTHTDPAPGHVTTLDHKIEVIYHALAIPMGVCMIAGSLGLEHAFPHANDLDYLGMGAVRLLPTITGVIIGLNQIPLRLIAQHGQGGATAPMVFIATLTGGKVSGRHRLKSFQQAFQFTFVWVGTMLGSYLAMRASGASTKVPQGFSPLRSFVGGFLAIFGSKVAGSCTCGHGVSGVSELSLESFVSAACIFGGGIATAVLFL